MHEVDPVGVGRSVPGDLVVKETTILILSAAETCPPHETWMAADWAGPVGWLGIDERDPFFFLDDGSAVVNTYPSFCLAAGDPSWGHL